MVAVPGSGLNGALELNGADANDNLVEGNRIGTDITGTVAITNGQMGLCILNGATGNTIGGTAAGAGNVISGNSSAAC